MNTFKKALLILTLLFACGGFSYAAAPSFNDNFAKYTDNDEGKRLVAAGPQL